MVCRFPRANDASELWRLLEAGENAVIEGIPGSGDGRVGQLFQDAPIQSEASRHAAFIDGVDLFDAPSSASRRLWRGISTLSSISCSKPADRLSKTAA